MSKMSGMITGYQDSAATAGGDSKQNVAVPRSEPLKRFTDAKNAIGDIFSVLESYVTDLSLLYSEILDELAIVQDEQVAEVNQFKGSVKTIRDMFMRDTMKVVFFGRTSNGKSSVINAMLHSKVLPQGMGHTTCCFLQVEGSKDNETYVLREDSTDYLDIKQLQSLGHAMSASNSSLDVVGQDSLLRVFYPKAASRLLQNDVVIVDSPGVDLSPESDSWIDKHCLDADVFVLVCNAESTLTRAEKDFFHRVSAKLSKPNVFILVNRWDASAAETENMNQIRGQHMSRCKHFLVNELKVCNEVEATNRIYFISAREVLDARMKEKGLIDRVYQVEGHKYRASEFANFETQFEHLISKSAISTKFEAHEKRAREIVSAMRANLDVVQNSVLEKKEQLLVDFELRESNFKKCWENWIEFQQFALLESRRLDDEVHLKVAADFYEEISRLEAIIDRFNEKFEDDSSSIAAYKQALAEYVDKIISEDLEARCTGGLLQRIWNLENGMYHHVNGILGEPYQKKLEQIWRYRPPFNFSICINCPSLMKDFHEDLEFHFSLGITSLLRHINAFRMGKPITAIGNQPLLDTLRNYEQRDNIKVDGGIRQQQSQDEPSADIPRVQENDVMTQLALSSVGYIANGGLGLLVIGGLVSKTVGWRAVAAGVALYGGLYLLEYWRWNSGAKEQHLKDQFRAHLNAKLRVVASMHTSNCQSQVSREIHQVVNGLKSTVGGVHQEMKNELDNMRNELKKIDGINRGLNAMKGKTTLLNADLDQFEVEYLKNGSHTSL